MLTRRTFLAAAAPGLAGVATGAAMLMARRASAGLAVPTLAKRGSNRNALSNEAMVGGAGGSTARGSVITPNGATLPYEMDGGVKVFRLTAEPCVREFAPGLAINCWGYNGTTPGPTIEAVEGDRVRILATNRLPEATSVHWHGLFLPNGMDGVSGLTQRPIAPGETFAYEFSLKQHGTYFYHPHYDEMTQYAMGLMGFFIIHPREPEDPPIDRDFCIFLHEWAIHPGTATPDPIEMLDFNYFTFNGKVWPATDALVARLGQRVRIRIANISMDNHPIHVHGFSWEVVHTEGGVIRPTARWIGNTVDVPPGGARAMDFTVDAEGDWPMHCHKTHHIMVGMTHGLPNVLGVNTEAADERIRKLIPGYMTMGQAGMGGMSHDAGIPNYIGMGGGPGPFGRIDMSGMFTVIKVRREVSEDYADPGWYEHPAGTVAEPVTGALGAADDASEGAAMMYTCPMHPQVVSDTPGPCSICGMDLRRQKK